VISTQRGKGTFVSGKPDEKQIAKKRKKLLQSIIKSAIEEAHGLGYSAEEIKQAFVEELKNWNEENGN
jgi:DNA-binding transcriptional regulator YhcF (GntR family)